MFISGFNSYFDISIVCYSLFLNSAVKDNDTIEATSIEVENTLTDTTLTYDIENDVCTFTIQSLKAKVITIFDKK